MQTGNQYAINTNSIMRQIVTLLDDPVKVILLAMLIITIILVGELLAEFIQRRYLKLKVVKVIDAINVYNPS